jgi:DNA mismatch repair protein MutS
MSLKVVEQYLQTLDEYSKKLNKEKLTVLMQVGEFFEIYGIIYPDGKKVGNVWEFCDNVNIKVALKPQVVYNNPLIQVYMGGVGEAHINPYIQKAVERFGWTIVIFEQSRIGNSNKFERKEASIISPGININSDNFSNITLVIYIEQVKKYYTNKNQNYTNSNINSYNKYKEPNQINIGIAFIDCLTGENGVMSINNIATSDISIPFDEVLKLLTIKNPNELYIYLENIDQNQPGLTDNDLFNTLQLFNYNFKIYRHTPKTQLEDKIYKLQYQEALFEKVYISCRGLLDIMQQLGLDGDEHTYSRIALTIIIDFIMKHDKTIIEKLSAPEIMLNSDKYLMLANNSLEQLDIINNNTRVENAHTAYNKRISLLELLDNTKTPLGKILLRQQLSIPITDEFILEERYNQVEELYNLHINYSKSTTDKYGSPLYQLRQKLASIRNIDNYLRKIITQKINPFEISGYLASLSGCSLVYEYMKTITDCNQSNNSFTCNILCKLLPTPESYIILQTLQNKFQTDIILENLGCNVWNGIQANPFRKGINKKLDDLQDEIDNDQMFLDTLLIEFSKIIDSKYDISQLANKPLIYTGENANKGIHIFTNTSRKDILERYFAKPQMELKIGNYRITGKDIKFLKMKESKWEIEIPLLKTSNGTLKANLDRICKLAKQEFLEWLKANITNQTSVLDSLTEFARFIAQYDVLQSNTLNAIEKGYTKPIINSGAERSFMKADKIRHPIIEHINTTTKYVPNDVCMGTNSLGVGVGVDGILLFGVNAVGKSSLMKSLGINVIMAQAGMYVACSHLEYKPYKYLFTRIRNNDNLYAGLSSFEVEMKEFKVILQYADENSIILGDEIFKGTQADDATALVASALEILSERKSNFMFATHLHNLTTMNNIKSLKNLKMCHLLVEQDKTNPRKLIYSRKLYDGSGPSSYGILVCDAMNIDDNFVKRAKEIRNNMIFDNNITNIGSKYNKDKIISKCEICKNVNACDVHHINQQCDANDCNLIDDIEIGIFNKNKLWNLVSLCKECHHSVHSSPPRLKINGYITTSKGIELSFNNLETLSNTDYNSNNILEYTNQTEQLILPNTNINNKIINLTEESKNIILEMKKNNATPKKIQFDMKRYHKLNISQQTIRELI